MVRRRPLLRTLGTAAGAGLGVGLAGCTGDGSVGEIEESLEAAWVDLEAAGEGFDELETHLETEDWAGCQASIDPIRDDLASAEEHATHARQLAEADGHADHAEVATLGLDLIDVMGAMAEEVDGLCAAAAAEDTAEVNRRLETLDDLERQRRQTQQDLDRALTELEG